MALIRNIRPGDTFELQDEGIRITNGGSVACRLIIERPEPKDVGRNPKPKEEDKPHEQPKTA